MLLEFSSFSSISHFSELLKLKSVEPDQMKGVNHPPSPPRVISMLLA